MSEGPKRAPHLWRKGQSGNPRGRTPGSGEVAALRAAIRDRVPDIIAKLTEAALSGDVSAARLLLERVIAPLKAEEVPQPVTLPEGATLTEAGLAVLKAVARGELPPTAGGALLSAVGTLARVRELDDIERRVAALEDGTITIERNYAKAMP